MKEQGSIMSDLVWPCSRLAVKPDEEGLFGFLSFTYISADSRRSLGETGRRTLRDDSGFSR